MGLQVLAFIEDKLRRFLQKNAVIRVLVLGDSHVRVFEHPLFLFAMPRIFFDIAYVPGGTAYGIHNRKSISQTRNKFEVALLNRNYDFVIICLGEVDSAYLVWKRSMKSGMDVDRILSQCIENYCNYIKEIASDRSLVVLSAPLPTLPDQTLIQDLDTIVRASVDVSQNERTNLTLKFNREVEYFCVANGIPYMSGDKKALGENGLVRSDWVNADRIDHHYARYPYAKWLVSQLRGFRHPNGLQL